MSPVGGIDPNPAPAVPAPDPAGGHAGHGGGAGASFADAYASALASAGAAPGAGHAHAASPSAASNPAAAGNPYGAHAAAATGGPRFIPLAGEQRGENHDVQEMALGLRAYRQQLLASNIANADTPAYKAVDLDFREALRIAQTAMAASVDLATTHDRHLAGAASSSYGTAVKYRVPAQPSADGNTVEMDVERSAFAENAVMYEFSVDRVKGHYSMMMEMLKNLT